MAKFTDSIKTFKTGDLVFVRYPPRGVQPIHVTVFLEPEVGLGDSYVHAGATHLEIADISTYADDKDKGGYLHACTTNTDLRITVANVAALFAQTAVRTPYGSYPGTPDFQRLYQGKTPPQSPHASRFAGMIRTQDVAEIPFEFPALHRLLKWTYRAVTKTPLSMNRGITCAAFSAACHQVAGMRAFFEETGLSYKPELVRDCVSQLDTMVETKQALRKDLEVLGTSEQTKKPIYRDQAYREQSNRKLTTEGTDKLKDLVPSKKAWIAEVEKKLATTFATLSGVERAWVIIQRQMLGIDLEMIRLLSGIIDPAFFFDAKYVSSPALAKALRGAGGWKTTEFTQY